MERDIDYENNLVVQKETATYRSGDPRTMFRHREAASILDLYGPPKTLLSCSSKVEKGHKLNVLTAVLYMTPGLFCPSSTPECRKGCLGHTSGRMHQAGPTRARDKRAALYIEENSGFIRQLQQEITKHQAKASKLGVQPAVRLNGTSDIAWELLHKEIFEEFPNVQFYDYTKVKVRMIRFLQRDKNQSWPKNYHLTFSGDQLRQRDSRLVLQNGGNVAMVFSPVLPVQWWGKTVINGDEHDVRFMDPKGVIVGLKAKGIAQLDRIFVAQVCPQCLPISSQMMPWNYEEGDTHLHTNYDCYRCGYHHEAKWILPKYLSETDCQREEASLNQSRQLKLDLA